MKSLPKIGISLSVIITTVLLPLLIHPAWSQIIFGNGDDSTAAPASGSSVLSLLDTLGDKPPTDDIGLRLAGGAKKQGTACTTPDNEPGVCSFLNEPQCSLVVRAIQINGVTDRVIAYLRRTIAEPCGFEDTDYTLCCKSDNGKPVTPTVKPTSAPRTDSCGFSPFSTRIVGGVESTPGAWPWATILGLPQGSGFKVVCGGSLITAKHVLTAAHCFPGGSNSAITHVRLGEHDVTKTDDANPIDIAIASKKVHESYDSNSLKNDIAVVTLSSSATFSGSIGVVCLPVGLQGVDFATKGNPTIIGWGSTVSGGGTTSALRQASVTLVPTDKCVSDYTSIKRIKIGEDQLCAGTGATDTCTGDSGGPMMTVIDGGKWAIIGVTSFGVGCARGDFPGVYTRVDHFLSWISANSG